MESSDRPRIPEIIERAPAGGTAWPSSTSREYPSDNLTTLRTPVWKLTASDEAVGTGGA